MKNFFKTVIKFLIFGAMVFAGWQGYLKWEAFKSVLTKLEEKDPIRMKIYTPVYVKKEIIDVYRKLLET